MMFQSATEPVLCMLVRAQRERYGRDSRVIRRERLEEREDVVVIVCDLVRHFTRCRIFSIILSLASLVSSPPDPLMMSLYNSSVADSDPRFDILAANFLKSSPAALFFLMTTASVGNGVRRTAFSTDQSWSLLDLERSPTAARRRTLVVGIWILLPYPVKVRSASIVTTVGASSDSAKAKAVTLSLSYLFPMGACVYGPWTSLGVTLSVSSARFWKSVHTRLNLETVVLSKRIYS